MSSETLSYFLKNEDIKLKARFQVALQCAPFLKGIKISSVITMEQKMCEELQEIFEETGLSVLSSFADNMEVTAPKAQKGIMLKQVAEYYDIKSEEVVVFGDGWNDLSMIDQFPESYAMKNGTRELKERAAHITEYTNEESGVGKTVLKLLGRKNP